jgi:hypothetical protein
MEPVLTTTTPGRIALSDRHNLRFRPFRCDRAILGGLRRFDSAGVLVWVIAAMAIGAVTAAAAWNSRLTTTDLPAIWMHDVGHLFGATSRGSAANFPLMRDVVSLAVLFVVAVNFRILYAQWRAMESFLPAMLRDGRIVIRNGAEARVQTTMDRINGRFRLVGEGAPVIGVLALVAAFIFVFGQHGDGVFRTLAPNGLTSTEFRAWEHGA